MTIEEMEEIDRIVSLLDKARGILTANDPNLKTDMEVQDWNATPTGMACNLIGDAIDLLMEVE